MQPKIDIRGYFTKKEAAFYCSISGKTLDRWLKTGLPSIQVTPGGRVLIRIEDLDHFLNTKKITRTSSLARVVVKTNGEVQR